MNKLEYLKLCIRNKKYSELGWLVSIFSHIGAQPIDKLKHLDLSYEANSYNYYDEESGKLVLLEGSKETPLYTPREPITIDNSWLPIVEGSTDTTVGRLITNAVVISEPFRNIIPYINKQFSVSTIEKIVAPIVLSDPKDNVKEDNKIYISDYLKALDNSQYISNLSSTIVISASEKIMTSPEGLDEFMVDLISRYKGKLSDPVELIKFEDEIKEFDNNYLKDDASYGLFISGKIRDTARKKMYLMLGTGLTLTDNEKVEPILTSLTDGWNLNVTDFASMVNDLRAGSYARGAETIRGGVVAKALARSGNGISFKEGDCGTNETISRTFDSKDIVKLVDRYIVDKGVITYISNIDQANKYIDKSVNLRTPIYCKERNDAYCTTCSGSKIYRGRNNMIPLLLEISSKILSSSLKVVHANVLTTTTIDLNKNFT